MKMKRRGMLQRVLMLLLLVCLICGNGLMALADEAVASSMRLTKTEGTVSVTNKNGRDMGTMADMKLFNGYSLATAQASYAWMNLDDHKLVKLDAISEAEIQKKGKNLEVLLNSGNLLFNVSENLKSDETLNIRTSTMVTGIRGTCGWVKVVDSSRTQVYILEGQVVCYVMDPVTGQSKSITLHSGEMAEFVVYDQTRVGDKCDIIINRFDEKQIDGFVAVELMNDSELRDRITSVLNIDMSWIVTNAPSILAQNQTAAAAKFAAVNEAARQQTSKVVKDPVFGNDDDDDDNGSGSGGGSSVTQPSDPTDPTDPTNPTDPTDPTDPTEPETEPTGLTEITLTVAEAEADDQLNFYLSMDTMKDVTIVAADGDATLDITTITTISDGQTVTLDGVDLVIAESGELRINGELTVPTNVTNKGTISNTSLNSFIVGGTLINTESAVIENTGKIDAASIENNGTIISSGRLIGDMTVTPYGRLELLADADYGTLEGKLTVEGKPDANGIAVLYQEMPEQLVLAGGDVELSGITLDETMDISNGSVILSNGSAIAEVSISNTEHRNGVLTVNTGCTVGTVAVNGGRLRMAGGTVDNLTLNTGDVEISDGVLGTEDTPVVVAGGTVTVNGGVINAMNVTNADAIVEINEGIVEIVSGSAGTINVNGGTVQLLTTETFGENGDDLNGETDSAEQPDSTDPSESTDSTGSNEASKPAEIYITVNAGDVETAIIDGGELIVNGGTIKTLYVEGELVNATISGGTVTDGISMNGTGTGNSLNVTGGTIYAGEAGAAIVNTGGQLTISGGEIKDGIAMPILETSEAPVPPEIVVTIMGGTIHAGKADAAIAYDAGRLTIDSSVKIMAEDVSKLIVFGDEDLEATLVEMNGEAGEAEQINSKSYPVCTKENNEVILKRYEEEFITVLESLDDGDYLMLVEDSTVASLDGGYIDVNIFGSADKAVEAVIDLNGYNLVFADECSLYINDFSDTEHHSLTIIDSNGGGSLTVPNMQNYADLHIEGIDFYSSEMTGELDNLYNRGVWEFNKVNAEINRDIVNFGEMSLNECEWIAKSVNSYDTFIIMASSLQLEELNSQANYVTDENGDTLTEYGTLTITDSDIEFTDESSWYCMNNEGTLVVDNSTLSAIDRSLIATYGNTTITNGSILQVASSDVESDEACGVLEAYGCDVMIGDSDEKEVQILSDGNKWSPAIELRSALSGQSASETTSSDYFTQLSLENVKVSSTYGSALVVAEDSRVIFGEDVNLVSGNSDATVSCTVQYVGYDYNVDEILNECTYPELEFEGATSISNHGNGFAVLWDIRGTVCMTYDENSRETLEEAIEEFETSFPYKECIPQPINPEMVEIRTASKVPMGENVNIKYTDEEDSYIDDGSGNHAGLFYESTSISIYKVLEVSEVEDGFSYRYKLGDYIPQTTSSFSMKSSANTLPNTNGEESGEVDRVVDSTATDSNATPSNASGTPTASRSAIPMTVAMLAGLMAIAPKLFEDREDKKRKER